MSSRFYFYVSYPMFRSHVYLIIFGNNKLDFKVFNIITSSSRFLALQQNDPGRCYIMSFMYLATMQEFYEYE